MSLYPGDPQFGPYNGNAVGYFQRRPVIQVPPSPPILKPLQPIEYGTEMGLPFKPPPLWLGWNDPTPIYCMKRNPNVFTAIALPAVCRPNKAALAEMAENFKPLPSGEVVIEAENDKDETVDIVVNGNGEVVAEIPKPNIMPLALAAAAAFFFLM